ncbi:response regulator transcription factor [Kitasatospora sp. NPDC089509]|uniref:response regulator transcription factor n=1 Tax=Kitasatospora sp. NPDC089509 TaxID=3364079 RepID=UPI00381830FB
MDLQHQDPPSHAHPRAARPARRARSPLALNGDGPGARREAPPGRPGPPAPAAPEDPQTGLTATERELLRLLGSGLTNDAAGQRLGISSRTVSRHMSSIMERLGTSSRFETGIKAAQHGWLCPPLPSSWPRNGAPGLRSGMTVPPCSSHDPGGVVPPGRRHR